MILFRGWRRIIPVATMVLVIAAAWWWHARQPPAGPRLLQTVRICHAWPVGSLIVAADTQGFFARNGVNVILSRYAFGAEAMNAMLDDKCDIAAVADTPVVFSSFVRNDFAVIATGGIWTDLVRVIARRDRGIASLEDLKGKRIAVLRGTSGDFFLYSLLLSQRRDRADVQVVYVPGAHEMREALITGDVDAVIFWGAPVKEMTAAIPERGVEFSAPGLITIFDSLVARKNYLAERPQEVQEVLRAMSRAADAYARDPEAAVRAVANRLRLPESEVAALSPQMTLGLDQSLLLALEEEARWAIADRLVAGTRVPNYLDYIHPEALSAVRPRAVSVLR